MGRAGKPIAGTDLGLPTRLIVGDVALRHVMCLIRLAPAAPLAGGEAAAGNPRQNAHAGRACE
ncbi:hypothetical protein B0A89_08810 [Paracoccus contaminans]|uniref:Uncharacterized protein n=2 Tax=Paracoccus contaminans TaxID=1945662 RepID=A0A1W6CXU8_9RHOB|nr:hypothetical protein B0A89_08810 [Paracoccus contaminans]